jgi:hypothetical protein
VSTTRRTPDKAQPLPQPGEAEAGAGFDPGSELTTPATKNSDAPAGSRAMPAPGSPLPEKEMQRLKTRAATKRLESPAAGQHDPSAKRPRK